MRNLVCAENHWKFERQRMATEQTQSADEDHVMHLKAGGGPWGVIVLSVFLLYIINLFYTILLVFVSLEHLFIL